MTCKIFVPFAIACGYVLFISIKLLHSAKHVGGKKPSSSSSSYSSWDYQSFLPSSFVGRYGKTTFTTTTKSNNYWDIDRQQHYNYKINEKNINVVRQVPYLPYFAKKKQIVPTLLPKPIINVGFPKSGTSSIFEFFRCNGLIGQHWFCCEPQTHHAVVRNYYLMSTCILRNLANDLPILHDCGNNVGGGGEENGEKGGGDHEYVDVYSEINGPRKLYKQGKLKGELLDDGILADKSISISPRILFPQHHYLNKIHDQYPNSTFILHTRPVQDWVHSVMNWDSELKWELPNEFYSQQQQAQSNDTHLRNSNNWANEFSPIKVNITLPQTIDELPPFLTWLYEYHTQFIKHFVKVYPSHALVEIDITHNDTGTILGDAFGLDSTCWKQMNKASPKVSQALPLTTITTTTNDDNHAVGQQQRENPLTSHGNKNNNNHTVFPISSHIRRPTIPKLRHYELDRSHDFKKQQTNVSGDNIKQNITAEKRDDNNNSSVDAYDIRSKKRLQRINDMEQALEERRRERDTVRSIVAAGRDRGFLRSNTTAINATTTTVVSTSSKTTTPSIVVTNTTSTTNSTTTTTKASSNTTNTSSSVLTKSAAIPGNVSSSNVTDTATQSMATTNTTIPTTSTSTTTSMASPPNKNTKTSPNSRATSTNATLNVSSSVHA